MRVNYIATYNLNQKKYVYNEVYDLSKTGAEEKIEKNKFQIKGSYKTSGEAGGISIGQFISGNTSFKRKSKGRLLQEGVDYTVNYQAGRVQILDETLKYQLRVILFIHNRRKDFQELMWNTSLMKTLLLEEH